MQEGKTPVLLVTFIFLIVIGIVGYNVAIEKNIFDFGYLIVLIVYLIKFEIIHLKR